MQEMGDGRIDNGEPRKGDHSSFEADGKEFYFTMAIRVVGVLRLSGQVDTVKSKYARYDIDDGFQGV